MVPDHAFRWKPAHGSPLWDKTGEHIAFISNRVMVPLMRLDNANR